MHSLKFLCFIFLSILVSQVNANTTNSKMLVLGDSLSAGYQLKTEESWLYLLNQQWLKSSNGIEIINASVSGDTTDAGLARLPNLLRQHKPNWIIIELGGNDGLRGFQLKQIKSNLTEIIKIAQQNNVKPILFEIKIPPNYGRRYTKKFIQIYSDLATKFEIDLVPFFIEPFATQPDLMFKDQIHPNRKAQPLIVERLNPTLLNIINENGLKQSLN